MPVVLASSVRQVRLFRAGAVVTRHAALPAGASGTELALDGLPLALDDGSVRVAVAGPPGAAVPRPLDVRVELALPAIGQPLQPPSEEELRRAVDAAVEKRQRLGRIERELSQLQLELLLPEPFENRPPRPAPAAAWRGALAWLLDARRRRSDEKAVLTEELVRAEEHVARTRRAQEEARAAGTPKDDAVSKRLLLRLDGAAAPAGAQLHVEYRVPGARWAPTYELRVARDGKTARLVIRALVAQATGEPWERVRLSLSTASLLAEPELPELPSLRIGRRQATPAKRAWREPPAGTAALFEGLDAALANLPPPVAQPLPQPPAIPSVGAVAALEEGAPAEPPRPRKKGARPPPGPPPQVMQPSPVMMPQGLAKSMSAPPARQATAAAPPPPAPRSAPVRAPAPAAADRMSRARASESFTESAMPESEEEALLLEPDLDGDREDVDQDETGRFELTGEILDALGRRAPVPNPAALRYGELVMARWNDPAHPRGKLRPRTIHDQLAGVPDSIVPAVAARVAQAQVAASAVLSVELPDGACDVGDETGAFDHRYDAEGPVDVPADGRLHSVPLVSREAPVTMTLVVAPRESTQAVRVAALANPLQAPLLAGPSDVFLEDEFLVSSPIRTVPAGAELRIGLGVEEGLKVARNTHFEEEKHGMLGGGASLHHHVEIEVASRLAVPARVEIRERVPVKQPADEQIEIVVPQANPPWEDWDQGDVSRIRGGRRWRITLSPGESRKLSFRYTIKIDGKNEVVGGNRRE